MKAQPIYTLLILGTSLLTVAAWGATQSGTPKASASFKPVLLGYPTYTPESSLGSGKDCRALINRDLSLCETSTCKAFVQGDSSLCAGDSDCVALLDQNIEKCKSATCKAQLKGQQDLCETPYCKAIVTGIATHCDTDNAVYKDNCKALVAGLSNQCH